jgi:hypothetical protein
MRTVQAAIGCNGCGNQRFDCSSLGDIRLYKGRFPTLLHDHMDRLVSAILVQIGNNELGPFSGKCQGCGSPNP